MNRVTVVYIVMLAAAIAGLWAILGIGKHLSAPEDLAGKWQLSAGPSTRPSAIFIEQSGHFIQASIDDGPKISLKLIDQIQKQIGDQQKVRVTLAGNDYSMDFSGPVDSDEMSLLLSRPRPETSGQWTAKRVVRTFAAEKTKSGGGH